ncbi:DUF6807 domain-containing protein [Tautonia plasticadhaerens]|uniref:Glycoside hydrolase family 5 domain-containing protein n=1 Tax=Tautonia plasticadhaerens TaxID=2527974 RepID=A0A518H4C6_9BACT|nr:PmoA family protein [Tautonia plasticadhaerens]QDV35695.1 hypothetical protein ElP_36000 [Tautonia plasticadhaerens]
MINLWCRSLLVMLVLAPVPGSAWSDGDSTGSDQARGPNPTLTIEGDRFLLDGRPFSMWGIRTASGTQDDAQCDHLVAQLDDYKAHGVNTVAVYYMGCRGGNYDPFSPDGTAIDPGHQERMERIIRACAEREMVVVVGLFYQHAPFGLRDAGAVREAVRTATEALEPFGNIIINIANEQNSGGWSDTAAVFDFRDPERIIELCRLVHEVDPGRIVGGGGYDHEKNIVIGGSPEVDALLFDTAGPDPDSGALYDRFVAAGVEGKPIVNVELFGGWTGQFERGIFPEEVRRAYLREVEAAATQPGLSVFFHNNVWCQQEPMRYDLAGSGTEDDPGIRWYFEAVREATGQPGDRQAEGAPEAPPVAFEDQPDGLRMTIGGEPFATYVFERGETTRPFLEHLHTPRGVQVTRNNPPVEGVDIADHPTFHPGLWLAFGDLGGPDSWRDNDPIRHAGFVEEPQGGPGRGDFVVRNRHIKGGEVIAEEVCRLTMLVRPAGRLLIWDSEFRPVGGTLALGDQEEMGLGVRLATPLAAVNGGRIIDSEGRVNEAGVWGRQADWCSYSGEAGGDRAGILLMPDPGHFRRSWYHARDYGLLVANPFGRRAFTGGEPSRVVVEEGEALRLRFGVLVFDGEPDPDAAYRDFLEQIGHGG